MANSWPSPIGVTRRREASCPRGARPKIGLGGLFNGADHAPSANLSSPGRQRLFTESMFARLQATYGVFRVHAVGQDDIDRFAQKGDASFLTLPHGYKQIAHANSVG